MKTSAPDIDAIARRLDVDEPSVTLESALEYSRSVAISFSGAEDVILIDMAMRIRPDVPVFTLDTGRLHPETHEYLERVRQHYGFGLEVLVPDPDEVRSLVRDKGLFSFYRDGHAECCSIRKVRPLKSRLATLDAWVTGQRRDQSVGTRSSVPLVQLDTAFCADGRHLVKFNPLAGWSSARVWQYIREHDVPYNALHGNGYVSIGCQPCTRPVLPNQHEREGRWWWEDAADKECGLHSANLRLAGRPG
jgi:phosphoadenosine phosphosulfate reductase